MKLLSVPNRTVILLLLSSVLMAGCVLPWQPSVTACPSLPSRPAVAQPIPSQSYSKTAQEDMARWQLQLQAIPVTSKP